MFAALPKPLTASKVEAALAELPGWGCVDGALRKRFLFSGFRESVSFILRVAFAPEANDHHPEIRNVYNRVELALTPHSAENQVTANGTRLASEIEALSWVRAFSPRARLGEKSSKGSPRSTCTGTQRRMTAPHVGQGQAAPAS